MNSDETAADVTRRSRIGRSVHCALARLRADARRSAIRAALLAGRVGVSSMAPIERLRLIGVSIVTAAATNALLLQLTPVVARPAVPSILSLLTAASGVMLIVLAGPLAQAWHGSWIRRQLIRARGSNAADSGRA
jgi:hypothetical protein